MLFCILHLYVYSAIVATEEFVQFLALLTLLSFSICKFCILHLYLYFLYFAFVFVICLCCYCRVWSICFRLFSLVFRLINFTRTTAAVIMSATSQRKMFKASKPQIPQFVWKGEGRGAKVWSILLLDTFLKFSPNQPTLDSVDSAGKRQAP